MPNETSGPFAIFRVEKVKTLRHLKGRSEHNSRTGSRGIEHCNPERPPTLLAGQADAVKAWDERKDTLGIDPEKLRADATLGLEFFASASPEWWPTATDEQRTKWVASSMAFIAEKAGGEANILSAFLHEDEKTPHIQVLTIPAVEKAQKRRGRPRKGREDVERPETIGWTLSARDLVGGGSGRMVEFQTEYAKAVEDLGLQRGIPRKETGARNKSPAHWRAEQARLTDRMVANTAAADGERKVARDERWKAQTDRFDASKAKQSAEQEAAQIIEKARAEAKILIDQARHQVGTMVGSFTALQDARTAAQKAGILPPKPAETMLYQDGRTSKLRAPVSPKKQQDDEGR